MKDLYTFDLSKELAMETYRDVRKSYSNFFNELKIPYIVAEAGSGDMGGNLSHEYHLPSTAGEDWVISCNNCKYSANQDVAKSNVSQAKMGSLKDDMEDGGDPRASSTRTTRQEDEISGGELSMWTGLTRDRSTLVNVFYLSDDIPQGRPSVPRRGVNISTVKSIVPLLDSSVADPISKWEPRSSNSSHLPEVEISAQPDIVNLYDRLLGGVPLSRHVMRTASSLLSRAVRSELLAQARISDILADKETGGPLNLMKVASGETCPSCTSGQVRIQKAIELGHTFFLGDRYSSVLRAQLDDGSASKGTSSHGSTLANGGLVEAGRAPNTTIGTLGSNKISVEMGCYGIGISRIIGAVAGLLSDQKGLNWTRVMAPFEVIVIPQRGNESDAEVVYDRLTKSEDPPSPGASSGHWSSDTQIPDVVLDDRPADLIWKLNDADLIGFPVIVVLGKAWKSQGKCEVQCRRLGGLRKEVSSEELPALVSTLLQQL